MTGDESDSVRSVFHPSGEQVDEAPATCGAWYNEPTWFLVPPFEVEAGTWRRYWKRRWTKIEYGTTGEPLVKEEEGSHASRTYELLHRALDFTVTRTCPSDIQTGRRPLNNIEPPRTASLYIPTTPAAYPIPTETLAPSDRFQKTALSIKPLMATPRLLHKSKPGSPQFKQFIRRTDFRTGSMRMVQKAGHRTVCTPMFCTASSVDTRQ